MEALYCTRVALWPLFEIADTVTDVVSTVKETFEKHWKRVAWTIGVIVLSYLSFTPLVVGLLLGYMFTKAPNSSVKDINDTIKRIKEFIMKEPLLAGFLGIIGLPTFLIPGLHFYTSIKAGIFFFQKHNPTRPFLQNAENMTGY